MRHAQPNGLRSLRWSVVRQIERKALDASPDTAGSGRALQGWQSSGHGDRAYQHQPRQCAGHWCTRSLHTGGALEKRTGSPRGADLPEHPAS